MYTSAVQSSPPLLMQHSRPTLVSKPLIPMFPFYIFSLCSSSAVPCSWMYFCTSCFLSPMTLSGFFNGMLEVFELEALKYFTFFCLILSTLSASNNSIFSHLPLSGFLDSLLCALIAPNPGLAFSLMMLRTLAAASSFLLGRAYPFLNFLPPHFFHLIPTLIM